jgi:hypothetical protein
MQKKAKAKQKHTLHQRRGRLKVECYAMVLRPQDFIGDGAHGDARPWKTRLMCH